MPFLTYSASNFPQAYGPSLLGSHRLSFTWAELLWAAISVGRSELLHLTRHGPFSAFEIVYRSAIMYANLRETGLSQLERSDAYEGLDPSEKGAISYFIGLAVTKLFAHRLLDVPWLMHLDVYRQELQPILNPGGKPDLVGRSGGGEWMAVESKGRTHGYDATALTRAKEQVASLVSINGEPVALRIAMLTHFGGNVLQCVADDPEDREEKLREIELPLSEEKLLEGYYRPFREWLREAPNVRVERVHDHDFVIGDAVDVDVSVGVALEIARTDGAPPRRVPLRVPAVEGKQGERDYVGSDAVLVRVGALWSEENMKKQPQERRRI